MNINSRTGSGSVSVFFAMLFIASVALNVAFITGCETVKDLRGICGKSEEKPQTQPSPSETFYLREIAASLGMTPSSDKTPGDIAFDIEQKLKNHQKYRDTVLADEAFNECKTAIPTTKDTETFEAYHAFIKKIAGKRVIILDN